MAPLTDLVSCSVIEKDSNGDILWTWTYPAVSEAQKLVITRKCNAQSQHSSTQFICSRFNNDWFYIYCSEVFDTDKLFRVKQFALVLFTKDFSPQKYEVLCRVLSKMYCKTGSPVQILQLYLSVFIMGSCTTQENGVFVSKNYNGENLADDSNIRGLIKAFELEAILIYTALLLKKRIIIYHHSLEELLKWMKTFPALMKHRRVTDNLFPWVDLVQDELQDLKSNLTFVAGCRDSSVAGRSELYDLLVNIPAREITVASHAKESFIMTKTHKEIALFMVQLVENSSLSEGQIIHEIAEKTQDLLNQLKNFSTAKNNVGHEIIDSQMIREKNLPSAVENFLINLAAAENLTVV